MTKGEELQMAKTTKQAVLKRFRQIEKNILELTENSKHLKDLTNKANKMKDQRIKQIEGLLNSTVPEIRKYYQKELKGMDKFFKGEMEKTKKLYGDTKSEFDRIKNLVEGHVKDTQAKISKKIGKKTTKKKVTKKKVAKKTTKKTTNKTS